MLRTVVHCGTSVLIRQTTGIDDYFITHTCHIHHNKKDTFVATNANKEFFLFLYLIINKTEQVSGRIRNNKHRRPYNSLHYNGILG